MEKSAVQATHVAMVNNPPDPNCQVTVTPMQQAQAMLQIIKEVATTPNVNVEAIRAMMEMQRQLTQDQAERALNEALARLDIPHVKKNGKIPLPSKDGTTKDVAFAKWEDIDTIIRPLLRAEGLSLSFTAPARKIEGGGSEMRGRLSHREGAFIEAEISLPLDTGPGRNNLQAMGSTIAYGKKYLAFMLLNVVTEGQDDDGNSAELISIEQAAEIDNEINKNAFDKARILKWIGAPDIQSIPLNKLEKLRTELTRQANAKKAKP